MRSIIYLLLMVAVVAGGCSAPPPEQVRLEFPPGFYGLVKFVESPDSPSVVKRGGENVIAVPATGLVEISSLDLVRRGRMYQTQYPDGQKVLEPGTHAYYDVIFSPNAPDSEYVFVGTWEQFSKHFSDLWNVDSAFYEQLLERTSNKPEAGNGGDVSGEERTP
jgi:hypothetical protein